MLRGPWCTLRVKIFDSRTAERPLASCQQIAGRHSHVNAFRNMRGHLQSCIRAIIMLLLHYKFARSSLQAAQVDVYSFRVASSQCLLMGCWSNWSD